MVRIAQLKENSNISSKELGNEVAKTAKDNNGKAVFIPQEQGIVLSEEDIENNLDSENHPTVAFLYTNGCATCVGVAMTGKDVDGKRVNVLAHIDADSLNNVDAIFDDFISRFDSIDSIHMVSETALDPLQLKHQGTASALGREVIDYFKSKSETDVKNAKVSASGVADTILLDLNTGDIKQSKAVLSTEYLVNPLQATGQGEDMPDWIRENAIVVSKISLGSPDDPNSGEPNLPNSGSGSEPGGGSDDGNDGDPDPDPTTPDSGGEMDPTPDPEPEIE